MKQEMNIDSVLEQLRNRAPQRDTSFSYQHLMHKIKQVQQEKAPKALLVACIILMASLLTVNVILDTRPKSKEINIIQELNLMHNNSIYG